MSFWAAIWVMVISVFAALTARNAYQLYRHPREVRNSIGVWNAEQARRIALAALMGTPIIWLLIVLSSFGLLGRAPF